MNQTPAFRPLHTPGAVATSSRWSAMRRTGPALPAIVWALLAGWTAMGNARTAEVARETTVRVASFACDVTPPLGHPLCGGWIRPLEAVDDPLWAKGLVLAEGDQRHVICVVDWCLLQTGAHDLFRRKLASAAGASGGHVTVHTVHQHNAPLADTRAQELLDAVPNAPRHLDPTFLAEVTDRLALAAREACGRLEPVTRVGHGRARVERFASNRRVRLADGAVHVRYSATRDPVLVAAPEGLIDPWLRTVTLAHHDRPLVHLHYYATHPMSYYGDGRATADTVGLAREQLEREEGVPQLYFTGCAGNITAGKYNDGSPEARRELTGRIHAAMQQAIANTIWAPLSGLDWAVADVAFAARQEPEWSADRARMVLADAGASAQARLKAALDLAWLERWQAQPTVAISRLRLGPVTLLHLPGEAFVEYQLYAQSLRPAGCVAVAAYGESGPGYICCDAALTEGGYEPTMSRVGPPSEFRLKEAIANLVGTTLTEGETPFYPDKLRLRAWRDDRGVEHEIRTTADWARRRAHILAAMERVMGQAPARGSVGAPKLEVISEERFPGYLQRRIRFDTADGDRVPAYLLIPSEPSGRRPAMLCLHQTTPVGKAEPAGLAGSPNLHYARELARRGFVALAPDYPNFGDYQADAYALGYASATMKGIVNHRRAVDVLVSLAEVDPGRLGVIGHSLGGHNALFVAAFEPRLRAVVTSCGFNSFFKYQGGDLTGWSHAGYMPRIAAEFGRDAKQMPFDFTEVLAALAPRAVFVNAPREDSNFELSGVQDCFAAARPVYALFGASDRLVLETPDAGHDFPPDVRGRAYAWLEAMLD